MTGQVDVEPLSRRERIDRMRARSWVLQILYLWEAQGGGQTLTETLAAITRTRRISPSRIPLMSEHLDLLERHLVDIDRAIQECTENWRLERLSRIDRSVLRLAVAEILYTQRVPPKVAIQEGIRLAGQYGGEDSHRFVNGVLDAVYRSAMARDRLS